MRFSIAFLFLAGCMANDGLRTAAMSEANIYKLSRVSLGMSQTEVLHIMRQPYSRETFQIERDSYDIWFYVTRPTGLGQSRMVPQNLTPLTFKNGILVGWGFDYYRAILKKQDIAQKVQALPQKEEPEDLELEKALQQKAPTENSTEKRGGEGEKKNAP